MAKLSAFLFITLDGYYHGANHDISWHKHGEEETAYSVEGLKTGNILLFGRITYQMMASFWPTPMGSTSAPVVAEGMNTAEKIVFSRTLAKAEWRNTRLVKDHLAEELRTLKQQPGKDMTILGSGSIVTQCAELGLIDEYAIMVDPVAIGSGTPIFEGLNHKIDLKLTATRTFRSGVVLLSYQPA